MLNLSGEIRQLPLLVPDGGSMDLNLTIKATSVFWVHSVARLYCHKTQMEYPKAATKAEIQVSSGLMEQVNELYTQSG